MAILLCFVCLLFVECIVWGSTKLQHRKKFAAAVPTFDIIQTNLTSTIKIEFAETLGLVVCTLQPVSILFFLYILRVESWTACTSPPQGSLPHRSSLSTPTYLYFHSTNEPNHFLYTLTEIFLYFILFLVTTQTSSQPLVTMFIPIKGLKACVQMRA